MKSPTLPTVYLPTINRYFAPKICRRIEVSLYSCCDYGNTYDVFVCFHLHLFFAFPISMKAYLIDNIFSNRGYSFQLIYMLLMLASYSIWRVDWVHSFCAFLDQHAWYFSMFISHLEKNPMHRASAIEILIMFACNRKAMSVTALCSTMLGEGEYAFPTPSGDGSADIWSKPTNPCNPRECTQGAPPNRGITLGPYSQFCIFTNLCTRL